MVPNKVGISPRISCWEEERDPSRGDLVFLKEIPHNSNNYQTSPGWAVSSSQHGHIEYISFLLLPFFKLAYWGPATRPDLGHRLWEQEECYFPFGCTATESCLSPEPCLSPPADACASLLGRLLVEENSLNLRNAVKYTLWKASIQQLSNLEIKIIVDVFHACPSGTVHI